MQQDYNQTMNLPQTDFPMRAGLPQREPEMLAKWEEEKLYDRLMEKNEGKPLYVLHDGPPYANGDIHLGTAMNKVIKDIIVRYHNLAGYQAPYVPGWDTHGLPIELKARAKAGLANAAKMAPVEIRAICRDFALQYVDGQRRQFKRLGVWGEWDNPYLTLKPEFEARQIEVFGEMAMKGYIYKGLKPVYWCPECQTALAEAEIEYAEDTCYSVYVKFPIKDDKGLLTAKGIDLKHTYFVIWTTTTWTLPANVAICLGPDFTYRVIRCGEENYIMADALYESVMEKAGKTGYEVLASFTGRELEYMVAQHPFLSERDSLVIVGDHVTLESGTGCVHTAPGHGLEDFEVCKKYPELPIVVPVDSEGRMTEEAGPICVGMTTDEAGKAIALHMDKTGSLFAMQKLVHQYPHCWRCKKPVLFRATEQWFCSVESFKDEAVEAIKKVKWIPGWGEDRITSMVRERSDWCISRQRLWGVPIPIFYCEECHKPIIDRRFIQSVSELFREEGSDAWYTHEAAEILPEGATCPYCGGKSFRKESDIMDVWFDSGTSYASTLERPYLHYPADLYMEGGDQYRGWFQSSLLTSVAWRGEAPYKAVLTHGWTVDGEGKKMSKSLGNVIAPEEIIKDYGADILRLWVATTDYRVDVRISKEILKQLSESYRKIRNTARFILSNLYDFVPDRDSVTEEAFTDIDRWALTRLSEVVTQAKAAYEAFEFHEAFYKIHNFCTVDLSNFYLDVLKDRLYADKADGESRRAAQTALYRILHTVTRLLAPILAFTAEEIWSFLPHGKADDTASVMFNELPGERELFRDETVMAKWEQIHRVRDDVKKALEEARGAKVIGSSLDARVTLYADGDLAVFLRENGEKLKTALIVSQLDVLEGGNGAFAGEVPGLTVSVAHAEGEKCVRCWVYSDTVGKNPEHPCLCARCAALF